MMRDLLEDLEAGRLLSDPDPVNRARAQMKAPLPKRFYTAVSVAEGPDGVEVRLDNRTVKTPAGTPIRMPGRASAELVAREFDVQREVLDPATMPVWRLANTAIDGVAADPQAVMEDIMRYASSDLVCYRAESPETLVGRQADSWDPVLDWARRAMGARFFLAEGVMHVEQPREAIGAVGIHLSREATPMRLAALHVMTTLTGSALIALAVDAEAMSPEEGWRAAHVDEDWNIHQWGEDAEAMQARALRERDFQGAAALIEAMRG